MRAKLVRLPYLYLTEYSILLEDLKFREIESFESTDLEEIRLREMNRE